MISVIIPVYKAEAYLPRCIDSILSQTYTDLEIILVDDGSPDHCGAICDAYAQKDSRIKVIHQENQGVSVARNSGIDIANGDWISFVDADDFLTRDMYAQMLTVAEKENADMVETTYQYGKWENQDTGECYRYTGKEAALKIFRDDRHGDGICVSPCTKLFRRSAVGTLRFLPNCSIAEDMLFIISFLCRDGIVVKLDKTFYTYFLSEDSAMRSQYNARRSDEVDANQHLLKLAEEYAFDALYAIACRRYLGLLVHHWAQCRQHSDAAFQKKAQQLRNRFQSDYPHLAQQLFFKERLKYDLFYLFPGIFYQINKARYKEVSS